MSYASMLVLCVLAFACLALAMERHQEALFARPLEMRATKMLRTAGWILLCASLIVALRQPLWSVGLVSWFGCLSAGAGAGVVFVALMGMTRARTLPF